MLRSLLEVLWVFVQLGVTSFGGPAGVIAIMHRLVVQKRRWLSTQEFFDYTAASYLIPGPIAVQLALHLGYRRAGIGGALAAVAGFVTSAAAITWLCAIAYVQNQQLPQLDACLHAVRPAILAVILVSLWELGKGVFGAKRDFLLLAGTAVALLAGGNPILVLIAAVFLATMIPRMLARVFSANLRSGRKDADHPADQDGPAGILIAPPTVCTGLIAAASSAAGMTPWALFLGFAKIGLFLYGGGGVIAAYLTNDFVKTGILTHQQLLDALAIGTSTPGPILTVATFIGYLLGGTPGAIAATLGIIAPCIVLASLLHSVVRRVRDQAWGTEFSKALTVAVMGLILGVCLELAGQVFTQPFPIALGIVCLFLLTWLRTSPVQVILAAALVGLLLGS